ncbi:MAG TPA: MFS transporter [Nakamurella sp.]
MTSSTPFDDSRSGSVLRTNTAFRRLWSARTISAFGDSLGLVALIVFLAQNDVGDAFAVAGLLLVGEFIPSLLGPFAGALSDRFDRLRVMVLSELVQAMAMLTIAITLPPIPVLFVLVAVQAVAAQVLQPAARSVIPALVADRQLESANSAIGFGVNGMEAFAPFVAAALLDIVGIRTVLLIDVATFLVSAVLLAGLRPVPHPDVGDGPRPGILADAMTGVRFMIASPLIRVVGMCLVAVVVCNGVDDVALLFLTRDALDTSASAVGILYGAVGVGLLGGYLLLGRRGARISMVMLFLLGCAISSLGNLLTGLAWSMAVAFTLQLLRGVGLSAMDIGVTTLFQREVPAAMAGRVFGTLYGAVGAVGAGAAISYLAGAALLEAVGPRLTFIIAGGIGLLCTAIGAVLSRVPPGSAPRSPVGEQ